MGKDKFLWEDGDLIVVHVPGQPDPPPPPHYEPPHYDPPPHKPALDEGTDEE